MGLHAVNGRRLIRRFRTDESGATAIEYGLICGIIAVALTSIAATGGALEGIYDRMSAIIGALGGDGNDGG
jgi:pilus assembly protein Flp/PilA